MIVTRGCNLLDPLEAPVKPALDMAVGELIHKEADKSGYVPRTSVGKWDEALPISRSAAIDGQDVGLVGSQPANRVSALASDGYHIITPLITRRQREDQGDDGSRRDEEGGKGEGNKRTGSRPGRSSPFPKGRTVQGFPLKAEH